MQTDTDINSLNMKDSIETIFFSSHNWFNDKRISMVLIYAEKKKTSPIFDGSFIETIGFSISQFGKISHHFW